MANAFVPFGGQKQRASDVRYKEQLKAQLEAGDWVAFKVTYQTYITWIWSDDHIVARNSRESDLHKRMKVVVAEFLDRAGHEMPTQENLYYHGNWDRNKEWVYSGECFEVGYVAGEADVTCKCNDCSTYAEVGKVAAKKWYQTMHDGSVDTLVVAPYRSNSDLEYGEEKLEIYLIHRNTWG